MPGANLYYRARPRNYQSQFVPLPLSAMAGALNAKQKRYDTNKALIDQYADYEINALPGDDTGYADKKEKEVQAFVNESVNQDLADPEYMRKFTQLTRSLQDDKNIEKIENHYAHHQKELARMEELTKKGGHALSGHWDFKYNDLYKKYTTPGSGGWRSNNLGDYNIHQGVNVRKEVEPLFNNIPAATIENVKQYTDPTTGRQFAYETSVTEVSKAKIANAAMQGYQTFSAPGHPAGGQLRNEYDYLIANGVTPTINSEEVADLLSKRDANGNIIDQKNIGDPLDQGEFIFQHLYDIGMENHNPSYKSDIATAIRTAQKTNYEEQMLYPQDISLNVKGTPQELDPDVTIAAAGELLDGQNQKIKDFDNGMADILSAKGNYIAAYNKYQQETGSTDPNAIHLAITENPNLGLNEDERNIFAAETPEEMLNPDYLPTEYRNIKYAKENYTQSVADANNHAESAISTNYEGGSEEYNKQKKIYEDNKKYSTANTISTQALNNLRNDDVTNLEIFADQVQNGGLTTGGKGLYYNLNSDGTMNIYHSDDTKQSKKLFTPQAKNLWQAVFGVDPVLVTGEGQEVNGERVLPLHDLIEADGSVNIGNTKLGGRYNGRSLNEFLNLRGVPTGGDSDGDRIYAWYLNGEAQAKFLNSQKRLEAFKNGDVTGLNNAEKITFNDETIAFPRGRALNEEDKTYIPKTVNDQGNVISLPVSENTNAILDNLKGQLDLWEIRDNATGKIINKNDIDASTIKFAMELTNKLRDEAQFEGTVKRKVGYGTQESGKPITGTEDVSVTMTLTGAEAREYNLIRARELYSNYLSDPNTVSGINDYINFVAYDNPDLSRRMFKLENNNEKLNYKESGVTFEATPLDKGRYRMNISYEDKVGAVQEVVVQNAKSIADVGKIIRATAKYERLIAQSENHSWTIEDFEKFMLQEENY